MPTSVPPAPSLPGVAQTFPSATVVTVSEELDVARALYETVATFEIVPAAFGTTGRESDVRIVGNAIDNVVVGAVRHRHGRIGAGVHGADRCSQRYVLVNVAEGLGPGCDREGSDGDIGDRDRDRVRSARGRKPAPQLRK